MKKLPVEFLGTFFLMLTIGMTVLPPNDAGPIAPIAIGAILIAMIFAGGHVSGAYYNPAVTLAVFLRGKCGARDIPGYILAQCAGAGLAAFTVLYLKGQPAGAALAVDPGFAFVGEFLFTFALVTVILHVATCRGTSGNSFYGFAIGLTVVAGAFAMGPVTGAAFNPAIVLGVTILGIFDVASVWIYLLANFAAAAAAAALFKVMDLD